MPAAKARNNTGTASIRRIRQQQNNTPLIIEIVDLEKTLLRKVGEAIHRFKMIRDGDRVAVALSGGKDSATLLEALLLLQKRAPIEFSVRSEEHTSELQSHSFISYAVF